MWSGAKPPELRNTQLLHTWDFMIKIPQTGTKWVIILGLFRGPAGVRQLIKISRDQAGWA